MKCLPLTSWGLEWLCRTELGGRVFRKHFIYFLQPFRTFVSKYLHKKKKWQCELFSKIFILCLSKLFRSQTFFQTFLFCFSKLGRLTTLLADLQCGLEGKIEREGERERERKRGGEKGRETKGGRERRERGALSSRLYRLTSHNNKPHLSPSRPPLPTDRTAYEGERSY